MGGNEAVTSVPALMMEGVSAFQQIWVLKDSV